MQVRRKLAVITATALLGTLAAGCGGGSDDGADAALDVWTRSSPEPAETYKQIFAAFTAKTGIKVNYQPVLEFDQQLQARAASKKLPDVFINDMANLGTYQAQGWLRPLDPAAVPGREQITQPTWDSVKGLDGKTYGVPFSRQAFATFIRKDWREKLKLPVPKTWDDLENLAHAFAEKDPDGNGKKDTYGMVAPGSAQNGYTLFWGATYLWQGGGDVVSDAGGGKYKVEINSPGSVKAVTWIRKQFCTAGNVQPGALTQTTAQTPHFTEGTAGVYLTGPYNFIPYDLKLKDKYEVVPAPTGPAGGTVLANGENIYLGAGSEKTEAQDKLAAFLITPEAQKLGMVSKTQAVVRIPVNSTLDAAQVTGDARWKVVQDAFTGGQTKEFPSAVQWVPIRNAAAEGLNKILSDCDGDVKAGLDEVAASLTAVLKDQGVLA